MPKKNVSKRMSSILVAAKLTIAATTVASMKAIIGAFESDALNLDLCDSASVRSLRFNASVYNRSAKLNAENAETPRLAETTSSRA